MGCLSEENIYQPMDSLLCYTHTHIYTSTGRQTHHSHVYTVKTHTHVRIAEIYKNVQSKQTQRDLTANDCDNSNWSDPSLLLGEREMCNCTREHVNTHKLYIISSLVYLRHLPVCVCVCGAQLSA